MRNRFFFQKTISINSISNSHKILKDGHWILHKVLRVRYISITENLEHTFYIMQVEFRTDFFCKLLSSWAEYSKTLNIGKILTESWTTFSENFMSMESIHELKRMKLLFSLAWIYSTVIHNSLFIFRKCMIWWRWFNQFKVTSQYNFWNPTSRRGNVVVYKIVAIFVFSHENHRKKIIE